jgi:hypothetical protein
MLLDAFGAIVNTLWTLGRFSRFTFAYLPCSFNKFTSDRLQLSASHGESFVQGSEWLMTQVTALQIKFIIIIIIIIIFTFQITTINMLGVILSPMQFMIA